MQVCEESEKAMVVVAVTTTTEEEEIWMKQLKYKGLSSLAKRHSHQEILLFEKERAEELKENKILVYVPEHLRNNYQIGNRFEFLDFTKRLYCLGSCYYLFLTKSERLIIAEHLRQKDTLCSRFLSQYKDCFIILSSSPSKKTREKTTTQSTRKSSRKCGNIKTKTKITIKKVERCTEGVDDFTGDTGEIGEEEGEEEEEKREAWKEVTLLRQTRDWELMKKGLMQEWADMGKELAVEKRENDLLREQLQSQGQKIDKLHDVMSFLLQQQQQKQLLLGSDTSSVAHTPLQLCFSKQQQQQQKQQQQQQRVKSVDEWIGPNLYNQQEIGVENRLNFSKWNGLFQRAEITPLLLRQNAFSIKLIPIKNGISNLVRLGIKLTYEYPLVMVLQVLADGFYDYVTKDRFMNLIRICPPSYKVVLLATVWMDDSVDSFNEKANRINIATILLHCQLVSLVDEMNCDGAGEDGEHLIRICREQDALLNPDYSLVDAYFPSFHSHGTNTYLSFTMGLNVVKKKADMGADMGDIAAGGGIGSNKCCAFCRTRARTIKNVSNNIQRSHQAKNCPLLATIGNNEVTILMVIMDVMTKSDKKQSDTLKNIKRFFGENDPNSTELNLNNTTLLRYATEEELESGQHINGLRINKVAFSKLRSSLIKLIGIQFRSKLFTDKINQELVRAFESLYVEGLALANCSIGSLILDSDGDSYLNKNRELLAKSEQKKPKAGGKNSSSTSIGQKDDGPLKHFVDTDQLFFSFDEQYNQKSLEIIRERFQFCHSENQQQQIFIANYYNPMTFLSTQPMNIDFSKFPQFFPHVNLPINA